MDHPSISCGHPCDFRAELVRYLAKLPKSSAQPHSFFSPFPSLQSSCQTTIYDRQVWASTSALKMYSKWLKTTLPCILAHLKTTQETQRRWAASSQFRKLAFTHVPGLKPSMVICAWHTSAWEVEAGGSGVKGQACLQLRIPGQPGLHETVFK